MWYGGGKLAADLTWPKLTRRWTGPGGTGSAGLSDADRHAAWEHAAEAAAQATSRIQAAAAAGDPGAAADAAWAASGTLHAAAATLGSRALRDAADAYDRAARPAWGRVSAPTLAGNQLRQASRLISAAAYLTRDPALAPLALLARLAGLAEAVTELRRTQQHAAQAAAARTTAEKLCAALAGHRAASSPAAAAARLTAMSFPAGPIPGSPHLRLASPLPVPPSLPGRRAAVPGRRHLRPGHATPVEGRRRHAHQEGEQSRIIILIRSARPSPWRQAGSEDVSPLITLTEGVGDLPGLLPASGRPSAATRPLSRWPGWKPLPATRHAAVSLWLNSGVPATEVARRAGHGVAVLLKDLRPLHRRPGHRRQPAHRLGPQHPRHRGRPR